MQADDTGDLPAIIDMMPDDDKSSRPGRGVGFGAVVKFMKPDFYGSEVGDRVDLDAARYQFPGHFTADIFLCSVNHLLLRGGQPSLVMVKLKVVGIKVCIFLEMYATGIICPKE